jgi:phospholipase C
MLRLLLGLGLALIASVPASLAQSAQPSGLHKIDHIVVIYLENHSFDNLFGLFPDANGLQNAAATATQVDLTGNPYAMLPPVMDTSKIPPVPDARFSRDLPNKPFLIDSFIGLEDKDPNPVHLWYQQQAQIDGGKMDKFAAISNAGGMVMGYHDGSKTKLWQFAKEFTLADNFFMAAFGGSFLNHFWLVCACTPVFPDAPKAIVSEEADNGRMVRDGKVTQDGYAINELYTVYTPHPPKADPAGLLPAQTLPTIGDRLDAKGISWAWYSGGWNDALGGKYDRHFVFHHQPFAYFKNYGDGTEGKKKHLRDEADLIGDIEKGALPAVAYFKPVGEENEHPGYANILDGDGKVAGIIERIRRSPLWESTVIIVTYDDNGGFWDHVASPKLDRWGPGVRVPTVIVSPFAKRGFVDHTIYDTTSILKLIESRFDLLPLAERDANANGLANALELGQ